MNRLFGATALIVAGVGLIWIAAKRRRDEAESNRWSSEDDQVGLASDDSFPASDPPSFTPVGGSQTGVAGGIR